MKTCHKILFQDATRTFTLPKESVDLVVTSPPYPMIEMWDDMFCCQSPIVKSHLESGDGVQAFEAMHRVLDQVWRNVYEVLKPGGIACINVGDATRSINAEFRLFSNHARIVTSFLQLGFANLPNILWRKQTNAPNKFMGSGMLPVGAYVTLEHEYILIFRKGQKREFLTPDQKRRRMNSAFFWEERNAWFSDIWDIKGTVQKLNNDKTRLRSAAFPFEIPYRLINMFSVKGDCVLDPFLGTGTTTLAAICSGRNSIGIEIDEHFSSIIFSPLKDTELAVELNSSIRARLMNHERFVKRTVEEKGRDALKHRNMHYEFPVMTRQETELLLNYIEKISVSPPDLAEATYAEDARLDAPMMDSIFHHIAE